MDATRLVKRIGMMVPSSNTVAEPATAAMLAGVPGVTLHVTRFRVTRLDTSAEALAQFQADPLLAAADLLMDAKMDAVCLNATASCYTGMRHDRALVAALRERGIAADTAMLALLDLLRALGARRIGLVTPFLHDVQDATIRVLAEEGLEVVAERHLNDPGNFTFARFGEEEVTALTREVAGAPGVQAVAIVSTNLRGARPAVTVEGETGMPVLDTCATALWGALRQAGVAPSVVRGWGRLFDIAPG
ncbi:maleate cis-trans isomerase family protein [Falsiroseomonas oryzae]|uniref:maleate cis-trans isomerase family protein n=1 Tax=Falsiroseomonas oryzae TaxID=2766473 RepID=UPI0022EB1F07|nr:Asp/Glu/hydantoin racemase [Roseomonas sp. MO-31]